MCDSYPSSLTAGANELAKCEASASFYSNGLTLGILVDLKSQGPPRRGPGCSVGLFCLRTSMTVKKPRNASYRNEKLNLTSYCTLAG